MQIHAVDDHIFHAAHEACAVGLGEAAGHSHILKTTYWEGESREMKERKRKRERKTWAWRRIWRKITGNTHTQKKNLILNVMGSRYDVLKHQSLLKPARTNLEVIWRSYFKAAGILLNNRIVSNLQKKKIDGVAPCFYSVAPSESTHREDLNHIWHAVSYWKFWANDQKISCKIPKNKKRS